MSTETIQRREDKIEILKYSFDHLTALAKFYAETANTVQEKIEALWCENVKDNQLLESEKDPADYDDSEEQRVFEDHWQNRQQ